MIPDEPIVLTGAASGIGNATARRLLDRGRTVISLDIQTPTAAVHTHYDCDLSDPALDRCRRGPNQWPDRLVDECGGRTGNGWPGPDHASEHVWPAPPH